MIRINQVKLNVEQEEGLIIKKVAKLLRVNESEIVTYSIVKKSLDARKKDALQFSYVVDVEVNEEQKVLKRSHCNQAEIVTVKPYVFPKPQKPFNGVRPVIIGMGPAGLFCGYYLALSGFQPLLFERGKDVDLRTKDVEALWQGGSLNPESNVQFGEGGAGTFSDGKLNTLVKDKYGRNREVLRVFVKFGAPENILYESKPHIGTDILKQVVKNMREEIIRLGGQVFFESQVTDIGIKDGKINEVIVNGKEHVATDSVVVAIGHSARNTFEMLHNKNIYMEAKPFAVGFRVEHEQSMINISQYGEDYPEVLPPSSYKVATKAKDLRGVYSFCMCPGGYVVNASSEDKRLCVNGMSYSKRDGKNANSAIIVTVNPSDYQEEGPLSGMHFQRRLEEKAYEIANGKVPVQTYYSFKNKVNGNECFADSKHTFEPAIKGQYEFNDITGILPMQLNKDIVEGIEQFGHSIKGYNRPDTLLSGIESRTSSPLRIVRDEVSLEASVKGLYPCGEGAGYAGGITSAAMDGIKVAETLVKA